jgi:hypothetical protein
MKLQKAIVFFTLVLSLAVILAACGGGGGGGGTVPAGGSNNGSPLVVASNVSVVSAQTSTNAGGSGKPSLKGRLKALLFSGTLPGDLAATADYKMDKTNVYVQERTSDAFKTINQILCMMGQTKYDAMLNKGAYTALIDKNLCDSGNSDPSSAGQQAQNQSSGANMPDYMRFTVDASRADDSSPEYINVWVHQPASGNDRAALIYGKGIVSEGTSTTNPYGIFTFNFAGYNYKNDGTLPSTPSFKGTLEAVRSDPTDPASKVLLKFVSSDSHADGYCGLETSAQAVTLDRLPDGSAGAGKVYTAHDCQLASQNSGTESFQIAYDTTDFYRKDTVSNLSSCLSRTEFDESAWSYGLYDNAGARLARNSGFPITYGAGYHGWVGYWGVWTDNSAPALYDGETVSQVDYHNNSQTDYTVFMRGGKLKKHSREQLTLNDIKGIPLGYNVWSGGTGTNYQVVWDGSNFTEITYMPQNCGNNCTWANMPPNTYVDLTTLQWNTLNFWSDSLGGQAQVNLGNCPYTPGNMSQPGTYNCSGLASNSTPVVFYAEQVVNPGTQAQAVPTALVCYDNCFKATNGYVNPNDPYVSNMMSGPSTTTNFTFDRTNLMLTDGANDLISDPSVTMITNPGSQWGMMSGAIIDPAAVINDVTDPNYGKTYLQALACAWDNTRICGWQAWSLPEYYTWETGSNTWNQFVTLKSGSNFIPPFQAPLNVTYTDAGGTTYILQYAGFGQLQGIPSYCVDMNTGQPASCSDNTKPIRWVPQFTIPALQNDGSLTTVLDLTDKVTTYFVKPLDIEQRMAEDPNPANCTALAGTAFGGYTLPDISIFSNPTSAEPSAPAAPAVIGGVVQ